MGAMRLTFDEIKSEIKRVLVKYGMSEEKEATWNTFTRRSTGVYSHGTNRVARFVNYIQKGWVDVNAGAFPWSGSLAPSGFIMETWGPAS